MKNTKKPLGANEKKIVLKGNLVILLFFKK
jgi:hypothetical protein